MRNVFEFEHQLSGNEAIDAFLKQVIIRNDKTIMIQSIGHIILVWPD